MLLTLVEPRRGHEVAYNRWYERDHFYAGCMVGPYNFAGCRYVATADLKALRDPDPSAITGEPARGSYVAVYWVLDGYYDVWQRWALRQVNALHAAGRMFEERDHVHTLLYNFQMGAPPGPRRCAGRAGARPPLPRVRLRVHRSLRECHQRGAVGVARTEHLPGLVARLRRRPRGGLHAHRLGGRRSRRRAARSGQ